MGLTHSSLDMKEHRNYTKCLVTSYGKYLLCFLVCFKLDGIFEFTWEVALPF